MNVGLPVFVPEELKTNTQDLMSSMRRDKKATDTKMTFILASSIGETYVSQDVPEHLVVSVLDDYLKNIKF
jgi:3-dehydroquinate synthetase